MTGFLLLGFLVGMAHALEADHLAAVGALASSGQATPRRLAFLGASWGMGHSTMLMLISLPVILFGYALSARMAAGMEFAVGIMLVVLGVQVFRRLRRQGIHFHLHDHGDGAPHFHAHSHAGAPGPHAEDPHEHGHARFSLRAYVVGLAHGAAGSAGLVALVAAATRDALAAVSYVAVFGLGSILGMALLTFTASWPLGFAERSATRIFRLVQGAAACLAIFIGARVMAETGPILWGAG